MAGSAAPRVTYAWVSVNGEPYGLYTVPESVDENFLEHNFTDRRGPIHDFLTSKGYARKFEALSNVDDWYVKTDGA